jgi:fructokinase
MSLTDPLFACVEGGGTSFVCAVSSIHDPTTPLDRFEVTTTTPLETLAACRAWLSKYVGRYVALGIATFGPVDLNPSSPTYGYITATPKTLWKNTDVVSPFVSLSPDTPFGFDTDVNAPALAEHTLARVSPDHTSVAYVTVGTGVGVGLVVNDKPVHGLMHPEGGHVAVLQLPDDPFRGYSWGGNAPYNGKGTVESLASAVAITERLGFDASDPNSRNVVKDLQDDDEAWDHVANALANLCVTLTLLSSVNRIVLSGGIMLRKPLFAKIRSRTRELLNNYVQVPSVLVDSELDKFIGPSTWGNAAGVVGALNLAKVAYDESTKKRGGAGSDGDDKLTIEQARVIVRGVFMGLFSGLVVGAIAGVGFARSRR